VTRFLTTIPFVAAAAPLTWAGRVQAQTLETSSPEVRSANFGVPHFEVIALSAGLLTAAGFGVGYWLWRRRQLPQDGVERRPSQLKAYQQLMGLEKILTAEAREPRRAAMAQLLNLVPSLAIPDRSRAFHSLARHFCTDWKWLMDDKAIDTVMKGRVSRWSKEFKQELSEKISVYLESPQENVRKNAAAAHKWFQSR